MSNRFGTVKTLSVVGVSALVAWAAVAVSGDWSFGSLGRADATTASLAAPIDRTRKSDRLPQAAQLAPDRHVITSVEVVGLRDAAIVYRDRDGRVLYRSDPLSNATVVAKDVVLPEVTVRETRKSTVEPVAANTAPPVIPNQPTVSREPAQPVNAPVKRPRIPEGCDTAASPIASPQMAHILSKCLVEAPSSVKLASLQ